MTKASKLIPIQVKTPKIICSIQITIYLICFYGHMIKTAISIFAKMKMVRLLILLLNIISKEKLHQVKQLQVLHLTH